MIVTAAFMLVANVLGLIARQLAGMAVPGWLTVLNVALAVFSAAYLVFAVLFHRRLRRGR